MRQATLGLVLALCAAPAGAQEGGNQVYQRANANYGEHANVSAPALSGDLQLFDPKDLTLAPYVEASVLMNVKPDAFVAVFAVAQEGKTAEESDAKVDSLVASMLASFGVRREDVYVDFISQNPVYDYAVSGRTAREGLTGFQTKKTAAVRYTDRAVLDRLVSAAARLGVYDLIKVDYVVSDMAAVRERLFEEATKVVARKQASYAKLLGVALHTRGVSEERYSAYEPGALYKSYTAFEAGSVDSSTRVVDKRKTSTAYYAPLTGASFDTVVNPAGIEPVVQCVLLLKVRCELVK